MFNTDDIHVPDMKESLLDVPDMREDVHGTNESVPEGKDVSEKQAPKSYT